MYADFAGIPEALFNTLKIAERCRFILTPRPVSLPGFFIPEGSTESAQLRNMCLDGLTRRVTGAGKCYYERLESELSVINSGGYVRYFYLLADLCTYLRKNTIIGTGRGSAGGSLVCYVLNITDIDPILHGLIFERFLNPLKLSFPDIDIDVSDDSRDMAFRYLKEKYGEKNTSLLLTTGVFRNTGAWSAIARVLEIPKAQHEAVIECIPAHESLAHNITDNVKLHNKMTRDPFLERALYEAMKIEGLIRVTGLHAAGIAVSDAPIPQMTGLDNGDPKALCSLYTGYDLEKYFGIIKFDILGLRALSKNAETVALVKRDHPETFPPGGYSPEQLPLHDEKTLALLRKGDTDGIFQLESEGMKNYVRMCRPDSFADICALSAMYRPYNMKFIKVYCAKKNNTTLPHNHDCTARELRNLRRLKDLCSGFPALRDIFAPTWYLPVYQEQLITVISLLFDCSTAQADIYRRELGKKKYTVIKELEKLLNENGNKTGFYKRDAKFLFNEVLLKWINFSFSKAHAVAYALIAWQTAFLKAHFPEKFRR